MALALDAFQITKNFRRMNTSTKCTERMRRAYCVVFINYEDGKNAVEILNENIISTLSFCTKHSLNLLGSKHMFHYMLRLIYSRFGMSSIQ